MFDGTSVSNKLFIITVNNQFKLSQFFINRPGRIYYKFDYRGLDEQFVQEYLKDTLDDISVADDIAKKIDSAFKNSFTFDMLQSVVEEMNRYKISFAEAVSVLNIDVESVSIEFKMYKNSKLVGERSGVSSGDYWVFDRDEKDHVYFSDTDFSMYDADKNCAVFHRADYTIEMYTKRANSNTRSVFFDALV